MQKVLVPNIGDFKNVEIIEVLVKPGDKVNKNDSIITLESDKSSVEVPSSHSGTIKDIKVKIGDKVSEGDLIMELDGGESSSVAKTETKIDNKNETTSSVAKQVETPIPLTTQAQPAQFIESTSEIKPASPKTRKFARELGININEVMGSQRSGRVIETDVKNFVRNRIGNVAPSQVVEEIKKPKKPKDEFDHAEFGEVEIKDIPRVKRLSGPHLVRSWTEIPHVTQQEEIDITEMETFRKSLRDLYTGEKISVSPLAFIIRAMVSGLKTFPNFNCSLDSDNGKVIYKKYYHIGVAVDTPHGLMVPKVRDADKLEVKKIGAEVRRLSKLCKELKIDKKEFFGGSMTISSLGGIGGTFFTPIINPPEVSILGVGKAYNRLINVGGRLQSRIILPISLSYDHRIIDGAEGAKFCVHLNECLGKDFAFKLAV